jgi:hypothetical protein
MRSPLSPDARVPSLLLLAAVLVAAVGAAHSFLGERYLLQRLRRDNLPKLLGSTEFTLRTLRFAWHVTTIAWLGLAAVLLLIAQAPVSRADVGLAIGLCFLVQFAVSLVASRGRHLSWIAFLVIGGLAIAATRG